MEEKKVELGVKSIKDKEEFDDLEKVVNDILVIVIENEQDKLLLMFIFLNILLLLKKEQFNDSLEDDENFEFKIKGELDWGGLDDLLYDLDVKVGWDLGLGLVVVFFKVKFIGMDYVEVDEEGNEEFKLLFKESAVFFVKVVVVFGGFDYDDIEDIDEVIKLMFKEDDLDSFSKKIVEKDDILDYV